MTTIGLSDLIYLIDAWGFLCGEEEGHQLSAAKHLRSMIDSIILDLVIEKSRENQPPERNPEHE